jgi:hypothetical protein
MTTSNALKDSSYRWELYEKVLPQGRGGLRSWPGRMRRATSFWRS